MVNRCVGRFSVVTFVLVALTCTACECRSARRCESAAQCPIGTRCEEGRCVPLPDAEDPEGSAAKQRRRHEQERMLEKDELLDDRAAEAAKLRTP